MNIDYIIQGMIFSQLSNLNSNNYIYIVIFIPLFYFFSNPYVQDYFYEKIELFFKDKKRNVLTFSHNEKSRSSNAFKALMYYISKNPNKTIKCMSENVEFGWDRLSEDDIEKFSGYRVDMDDFNFNDDIKGKFWIKEEKEKSEDNSRSYKKRTYNLQVISYRYSVLELVEWVENIKKDFQNYIKEKTFNNQCIFDVSYDTEEKDLIVEYEEWFSNVNFNNRFFKNKDLIMKKINFFLNNEEYYKSKGIPRTLGILLSGEPGCGKTSFIKCLLNHTKRHGINIKLTDDFDMDHLRDLIQKEKVGEDYVIPNDKKILIFEDIDCMGNIVKERENEDSDNILKDFDVKDMGEKNKNLITKIVKEKSNNKKNNLSYLLNILDGLIESNGRIIIMTTNHPEKLDKALTRPGRIDIKIDFTKVEKEDFDNIFCHYYDISNDVYKKLLDYNKIINKYTPAEIVNICRNYENYNDSINFFNKNI